MLQVNLIYRYYDSIVEVDTLSYMICFLRENANFAGLFDIFKGNLRTMTSELCHPKLKRESGKR